MNPNDYQQVPELTDPNLKETLSFEEGVATIRYQPLQEEGGLEEHDDLKVDIGQEGMPLDGPPGSYPLNEDKEAAANYAPDPSSAEIPHVVEPTISLMDDDDNTV